MRADSAVLYPSRSVGQRPANGQSVHDALQAADRSQRRPAGRRVEERLSPESIQARHVRSDPSAGDAHLRK